MSVIKVKAALVDFVKGEKDRAIVLKGAWGTGKTHLWRQVVNQSRDTFYKRNYSYVSLFGLNSLKDLKRAIYENKVYRERAHISSDESSFEENIKDISGRFAGWMRRSSSLFNDVSAMGIKGIGPMVETLQFLRVTDTIVCLDDFERKGSGLHDREVLGLISLLIESKNCRVVMLLNDGTLQANADFFSYHEKVFDYEITYNPTVEESVKLVFPTDSQIHKILRENITRLNINNIRLLKKIDYFVGLIEKALKGCSDYIVEKALLILPLAILAKYGGDSSKVDIDFIITHGHYRRTPLPNSDGTGEEDEVLRKEAEKTLYLKEYGLERSSEFDLAVISLVTKGYADEDLIQKIVEEIEREIRHSKDIALLREAWKIYHSSFQDNESEVLSAFESAIKVGLDKFSLDDLDSIASLYYDLGREADVNSVIDKFFAEVYPGRGVTDIEDVMQWPSNSYVRACLQEYFDGLVFQGTFSEVMQKIFESPNEKYEIAKALEAKEESEYHDYFSNLNDYAFSFHAQMLLKLGNSSYSNQEDASIYSEIFIKTFRVLKKMSETSLLNQHRMKKFASYEPLYLAELKRRAIAEKQAAEAAELAAAKEQDSVE